MHVHCHDRSVLHYSVSLTASLVDHDVLADPAGVLKVEQGLNSHTGIVRKWPKR